VSRTGARQKAYSIVRLLARIRPYVNLMVSSIGPLAMSDLSHCHLAIRYLLIDGGVMHTSSDGPDAWHRRW